MCVLPSCGGQGPDAGGARLIEEMAFLAYVDADGDGMSFDDEPRQIQLGDYLAKNRPGTKIIMLNAAAGWCGPCMHEASKLPELTAQYEPLGVAVLTAVFQTENGAPADSAFTRLWAKTFQLPIPTLIDATFATGRYFDARTMPANMFVDAETAEILATATGAEPGNDPMKAYRDLLDHYLER
jgi:thiol-disulfide isomerase/thioredoxin